MCTVYGGVGTASADFSDRLLVNGMRSVVNWPLEGEIKGDHTTHLRRCNWRSRGDEMRKGNPTAWGSDERA
jgi:hypothetical protein